MIAATAVVAVMIEEALLEKCVAAECKFCDQMGLGALPPTSGRCKVDIHLPSLLQLIRAPKDEENSLDCCSCQGYNERDIGLTVPCLSCHARLRKLSAASSL